MSIDQHMLNRSLNQKKFTNARFFERDFSDQDLSNADFRSASLIGCKFNNANLTHANFDNANCYEADFTGALMYKTRFIDAVLAKSIFKPKKCFGISITLSCDTFDGAIIDRTLLLYWLYMPLMMNLPDKEIEAKLVNALGQETYIALRRVFKEQTL